MTRKTREFEDDSKALDKAQLGVLWNLVGVRTFLFINSKWSFLRRIRRLQFEGVFKRPVEKTRHMAILFTI
ncbi:MAG: hypothetical protein R2784_13780 [Saprospiraceae bacterium]